MSVEKLRESRKGAAVIFTEFTRLRNKFADSLFCCFEGDDAKYYNHRIESFSRYSTDQIVLFSCGGKSEVLRMYELVNKNNDYDHVKFLYFIDLDFDPKLDKAIREKIYETPCYSIENLYTTLEAFKRVLKCEFNYHEADAEYETLVNLFLDRQQEFHSKTLLFNSWLSCQRDLSNNSQSVRLNLNSFNLSQILPLIDLDNVEANYNLDSLERLFPHADKISKDIVDAKVDLFSKENCQSLFRGKFEIDFLFSFIEAIKIEFKKPNPRIRKKEGVQINQSKKNLISEFSQYASTPNCLSLYLQRFALPA